jgi:Autotransporter beta-domain
MPTKWVMGVAAGLVLAATAALAQETPGDQALPKKWNIWVESRLFGVVDSVAQQQTLGVTALVGADTKVLPWLTAGLSVGYENFDTKTVTTNLHTISNGVGLQPYLTAKLDPNFYLTAFGGFTRLDYNTALAPGIAGQFVAWRLLGGANLTGVWHDGDWRFQPDATIYYGGENQQGYTTNVGSTVAPITIPFGRISAGPEIGYAFRDSAKSMVIEPFIKAHVNFDYITNNVAIFNGATFASGNRGQWSASLGAGAVLNTARGFFARLEASNESVGMNGLSVWVGQIRGGWNF